MKRRVCAILLAASLAVCGLTGCGNGSQSSAGQEKVRLMVWSPSEDQSKDSGQWLQTCCEKFAELHPEWDITFVYGVSDEASAGVAVAQDADASADVFMFPNDGVPTMRDANALAKFGGKYAEELKATNSVLGSTFWSVLIWTLVWAVFATFTNYFFGMILAIIINRKETHAKGFWRFCFVLSSAVPMFVSLLIMRTMLQPEGAVNVLRNLGVIAPDASLPFFTDPTWARVTVIIINIWVGVPYTLLQLTGVLKNIPGELYEAATVDGAGPVKTFIHITLPYMFYVTTPYLIAAFTGNVNNFNVIYLLSGGDPVTNLSSTAGSTDLLVTWLYKLTVDKQYYNVGAVVGILTFIILSIGALITYRHSKSYKEEGGF